MDEYLALEPIIIAHWKSQVPELVAVTSLASLEDIDEVKQTTPLGIVFYDGDDVIDSAKGRGESQAVDQRWGLVVAVRNVRRARGGSAAREDASPLIIKTINAFAGYKPAQGYGEFKRGSAPGPAYDKGYAYFPLLFTSRIFT